MSIVVGRPKKNILFYLSNPDLAHLYSGWATRFLQPDDAGWVFYAETPESFVEITRESKGKWHILVVDALQARKGIAIIEKFIADNPRAAVAVVGDVESVPHETPPFENARIFAMPADEDEWLVMMHRLLASVSAAENDEP